MSGGYFEYAQYDIAYIADAIEDVADRNQFNHTYSPEIIERFRLAVDTLRRAQAMAHRIDWLLSDDDGPESFLARWDEELGEDDSCA